ncbi:MAG: alpha/beta hydrolase [bacterium]|nr:alpha/beta hydrolase [bacterium]
MKKQIFTIHGGDAFATYEEYLEDLKAFQIDLDGFKRSGWKNTLQNALGQDYDVNSPRMPNSGNAKYIEWKIWFEKMIPYMQDDVILIGHSLGGSFLAKYLSEENISKKIKAAFLVSAPYDTDGNREIVEFVLPGSLSLFEKQGGSIFLIHSKDDPVVSFKEFEKYQKALPKAKAIIFEDRGHFNQESFPEIVEQIKNLN